VNPLVDQFEARGGVTGNDSPGLTTVDSWDQECQWRVEDLEESAHGSPDRDRVNGAVPRDKLDPVLARVRLGTCFVDTPQKPARLRVRFVLDRNSTRARHVMIDYRVVLPERTTACVRAKIEEQAYPKPELTKHAIVVHAFDTGK
jgi:hypothetical protein